MLTWIREKFGTVVIGGVISFIALIFVFDGMVNRRATRGLHEGAVAGTVNGDAITIADFNREYSRRVEFFKNLAAGKISDEQLKGFHIREGVFQEMVRRKLMSQDAERQGLLASDAEVRELVKQIPAFQKEGKFDLSTYKDVLAANRHSPGSFERLIREDASVQGWQDFFRIRASFSEEELRRQFQVSEDKRQLKYVVLTPENGRQGLKIEAADVQKYLAIPANANLVRSRFDAQKETQYKGQAFEGVKERIARELIASEKSDEVRKINTQLADQVLGMLSADAKGDAKINALLKPYGTDVKSSGWVTRLSGYLPGLGDARDLMKDAFAENSPILATQGGKAGKYEVAGVLVVALVTEAKKPDFAQFDRERARLAEQIVARRQRDWMDAWVKKLTDKAKVDPNPSVITGEES